MLDESLRAMKLLWTEPRATFQGRFYQLREAIAEPKPVQGPHPPIWIGSKGHRMLRLTARHADVWHSNASTFEESVKLSKALDGYCSKADRDPASLRRSISIRLTTPDQTRDDAQDAIAAGFSELLVMIGGGNMPATDPRRRAEAAADLLPSLRELNAARV
jgi:alkanesulfonate monooxygenase SsuD/methylene tetrahydromethanopterin reductase-like flavin-dependent oxidoreductase (luciferase family)